MTSTISKRGLLAGLAAAALGTALIPAAASAQSVEEFYSGTDITIIVATSAGGGYDSYVRLVGDFIGDYIPGNPDIIVENMPGAGGRVAAQYVYNIAPNDGSTLSSLLQSFAMDAGLGTTEGVDDPGSFIGIGRMTANYELGMAWADTGIETFDDLLSQSVSTASTGAASASAFVPRMINEIEGGQYNIIQGYDGSAAMRLAMESGEVDAIMTGLAGLRSTNPTWLSEGLVNVLWQLSNSPHPDFPDVVTIGSLGETPEEQAAFQLVAGAADIGRAIIAPPGVPQDRVEALREAFTAMIEDPAFLEEAANRNLEIDPATGAELQEFITQQSTIEPAVREITLTYVAPQ